MKRVKTSLCALAAAGALVATGMMASPAANAAPERKHLARTAPRWVAEAHSLGRAPSAASSHFRVYLAPRGGTEALKASVAKISDPRSSTYRHFLTASQFHTRYDASGAAVSKVSGFLRSNQLSVTGIEAHHRYLSVKGTNDSVQKAFGVSIQKFRHLGRLVQANTSAVKVPVGIAAYVSTVTGLDTTPHKIKHQAPPPDGFRNARPCSLSYGQVLASKKADYKTPLPQFEGKTLPYAVCGYTGSQFRSAYEKDSTLDGTGTSVAITDAYAAPTIAKDANTYATNHGDGSYAAGQLTQSLPRSFNRQSQCDPSGWYGEETLDVEAVHAMAPGAKIRYYASASCFDDDFLATLNRVVDDNKASLVSNSWSDVEANEGSDAVPAYEQVFLQGAMQGIGFLFSSGDNGDEVGRTGLKQVDYPASDPYATAVGGTSDAINAAGAFKFQTGWGTNKYTLTGSKWTPVGYLYGAGGGTSALFNQPSYQKGVVPSTYGASRAVPDVGLDADPTTGMLIGETQTFPEGKHYGEFRIGGTSLAAPLFAGMTALTKQHAGGRLGFLNPTIYSQAGSPTFTDIKGSPPDAGNVRVDYTNGLDATDGLLYSVRTFNEDSSLQVKRGWDDITGIGSPNAGWITSVKKK